VALGAEPAFGFHLGRREAPRRVLRHGRSRAPDQRADGREGRVERETEHAEVPITDLICRRLIDRSDLLDGQSSIDGGDNAWAGRALGRADEVRRPAPGSRPSPPTRLPRSRDFR
jgi:hypothetical protein